MIFEEGPAVEMSETEEKKKERLNGRQVLTGDLFGNHCVTVNRRYFFGFRSTTLKGLESREYGVKINCLKISSFLEIYFPGIPGLNVPLGV